jgi:hypothetical protein
MRNIQTAVSSHPLKIGQVYMNLRTRNSPYYHHLKYLLFLLKHPVYHTSICHEDNILSSQDLNADLYATYVRIQELLHLKTPTLAITTTGTVQIIS